MCLSPDDFETFFFATVAGQRDPEKLAEGQFQIKLEIESSAMHEITPLIPYVMVESLVFFEVFSYQTCKKCRVMNELFLIFSTGLPSQFEGTANIRREQLSTGKIHRRC